MGISNNNYSKDHDKVVMLLPWHVNGTLAGKEEELTLRHLRACKACQEERDRLYELQKLVQEDGQVEADPALSFRRTMKRIDDHERNLAVAAEVAMDTRSYKQRNRGMLAMFGSVAAAFIFLVAGVGFYSPVEEEGPATFETLSVETVAAPGTSSQVLVTFENPIPASALRRALIETRSHIVSGPDENGSYLVEVEVPAHMTDSEFIESMRAIEGVEYAQFAER